MVSLQEIANQLWAARTQARAISPLSEFNLDVSSAYQISKINFERRISEGAQSVGRKIGLTSLAVQRQLGVNEPDFGYLTSDMKLQDGAPLPQSLLQPRVEGEVAFILKHPLKGPGVSFQDVVSATDHLRVCIEVIDSRIQDWKIQIADTIADNASSAAFVLGDDPISPSQFGEQMEDLRLTGMTLWKNGEVESTGVGAACLGHPANAVAWLANRLGELGDELKEGDIILSGAFGPVVPLAPGDQCKVEIRGLGNVKCKSEVSV